MAWAAEKSLEFIKALQLEEVIWNPKHEGYKDRNIMYGAWTRLQNTFATPMKELKKKKDGLFAIYRKYANKVAQCKKSGSESDDIYTPTWTFYEPIDRFLHSIYVPGRTINSAMLLSIEIHFRFCRNGGYGNSPPSCVDVKQKPRYVPTTLSKSKSTIQNTTNTLIKQDSSQGAIANEMCNIYTENAKKNNNCPIPLFPHVTSSGIFAERAEFPHMVEVGFKGENGTEWLVSGFIISKNYVITVAHSTRPRGRAGVTDKADLSKAQIRTIESVLIHPEYKPPIKYNDIALIKIKEDFIFNTFVSPICLHTSEENPDVKGIHSGSLCTTVCRRSDLSNPVG
ncbi:unnamed protein product [Diabrotica balteata]|uniref:MADF domain-containing protein n=1 Tax=Diabrotica balteata TaxID=107213 RepID=A0A9N9T3F2_DIABA|nr:unnamed protein product [Diabrotica balteata]